MAANAQSKVSGMYVDSLTMQPVPFATVVITPEGAAKPEKAFVTDIDGSFAETTKRNGRYVLSVTLIGNKPVNVPFVADGNEVKLGTLYAVEENHNIKAVTVVAQKPIIKAEVDKISYDVSADPEAEAKNLLDMLRKMPLVTVDGDDNIKVNGSSSFVFHLNGRPTKMFDNEPGQTLRSIPASAVKNLQVITSPGAKYDAEGVGGIINIVMSMGSSLDGATATVSLQGGLPTNIGGGINAMVRKGKFTASANGFMMHKDVEGGSYENNFQTAPFDGTNGSFTRSTLNTIQNFRMLNLDMSYEIDTLRMLTATLNMRGGGYDATIDNIRLRSVVNGKEVGSQVANVLNNSDWGGNEVSLNYERKINRNHILTLSYKYDFTPDLGSESSTMTTMKTGTVFGNTQDQKSDDNSKVSEHAAQLDYTGTFNESNSIEAGLKYTLRNNTSDSRVDFYQLLTNHSVTDSTNISSLDHEQSIMALYGAYNYKYKAFALKAGLRVERSEFDAEGIYNDRKVPFNTTVTDYVPSLFMAYNLAPTQTIKASYNMRIMRPSVKYLNPYRNYSSPYTVAYGNVELDSELHHNWSLSFSSFGRRVMVNAELSYNMCDNAIVNYFTLNPDNVQESTYDNYGRTQSVGLGFFGNFTFTRSTTMWINGNVNYHNMENTNNGATAEGVQAQVFMGVNQTLPAEVRLGFFCGAISKPINLQSEGAAMSFHGISLSKSFLNDRLSASVSGNNIFHPRLKFETTTIVGDSRNQTINELKAWNLRFSVSYRFGDLKASVKKVRGIKSDDVMSAPSSNMEQQNNMGGGMR